MIDLESVEWVRGVVYYAVRKPKYVQLAAQSAKSLKRHMPSVHVTLFTDLPKREHIKPRLFDLVKSLPHVSERLCHNKILAIVDSPYDSTIFLDADSWGCDSLWEIFDALEQSPLDFMVTTVQQYRNVHKLDPIFEEAGVPAAYPRYESGMIGIIKNQRTKAFLERWVDCYEKVCAKWTMSSICPDQPALRIALYQSPDVRVGVLRDHYNYQLYGYFNRPVKVMQAKGTEEQFQKWEREANKHPRAPRYFEAGKCIHRIKQ